MGEEFEDGWLPTLDIKLRVNKENKVEWKYFEKPTTSNTTVQRRTAMEDNPMVKCLGNDMIRRFLNTEESLLKTEAKSLIDGYSVKLLTSGFSVDQTTRIVMSGIRGFDARLRRCVKKRRPLYRTSAQSVGGRRKKKLLGKTDWSKKRRKKSTPEEESGISGRKDHSKVMKKSG